MRVVVAIEEGHFAQLVEVVARVVEGQTCVEFLGFVGYGRVEGVLGGSRQVNVVACFTVLVEDRLHGGLCEGVVGIQSYVAQQAGQEVELALGCDFETVELTAFAVLWLEVGVKGVTAEGIGVVERLEEVDEVVHIFVEHSGG